MSLLFKRLKGQTLPWRLFDVKPRKVTSFINKNETMAKRFLFNKFRNFAIFFTQLINIVYSILAHYSKNLYYVSSYDIGAHLNCDY